jgi:hypothetical protein
MARAVWTRPRVVRSSSATYAGLVHPEAGLVDDQVGFAFRQVLDGVEQNVGPEALD